MVALALERTRVKVPLHRSEEATMMLLVLTHFAWLTDPPHPTGGRRKWKTHVVELPELPCLHTLASGQTESPASEDDDAKKFGTPRSSATTPRCERVSYDNAPSPAPSDAKMGIHPAKYGV